MSVARNLFLSPKLVPGGGAIEMELAARLAERSTGTILFASSVSISINVTLPVLAFRN